MDDYNGPDPSGSPENPPRGSEAGHACNSCRRRKLRCSRELPACQQCRKTLSECYYETKRAKPGMKAGALDNIHRRLDVLERSVSRQQAKLESFEEEGPAPQSDSTIHNLLSTLAAGLQKLDRQSSLIQRASGSENSTKRRRKDENGSYEVPSIFPAIPDDSILSHVLEAYFIYIHPWTPIIHEGRLRRRLVEDAERGKLQLVVHAMTLISKRYIVDEDVATYLNQSMSEADDVRDWLVARALKHPSVENLQALIIIACDYLQIGSGHTSDAWPIVGSLSRMVEYLQLTVEHDETMQHPFSQPYQSLPPPRDWTDAEERRRIFWAVFTLDRLCSVSMGWNTSLTADDVRRRLPCDGITWRKEDPVTTPYFGIWDRSAGRIGNPIAFLPSHPVQARPEEQDNTLSDAGTSPGAAASVVDMSTVGAYAYCIEATESLSRVTTYFLQQRVNLNDQKDFGAWLTRFKELDLRLVHWKMLLPQKWTVNVAQQGSTRMDPNLTLAHVTHNASMIMLHQPIAFPLREWPFKSRLPSVCSMETCQTAAIEVASITSHYLKSSLPASPLSSQFAFCIFIAARTLLLYWQNSQRQAGIAAEFWVLVQSLDAMSSRWAGNQSQPGHKNLPARYSSTLIQLHQRCMHEESFYINIAAYTNEVLYSDNNSPSHQDMEAGPGNARNNDDIHHSTQATDPSRDLQSYPDGRSNNRQGLTGNLPPLTNQPGPGITPLTPASFPLNVPIPDNGSVTGILTTALGSDPDDSMTMSQMLLDQQFTGLDRVISYTDGLFGSEFDGRRW
ncbi:Zn(II)2Cys6 transcription factor [Aspergillus stella-maris]|uniref:Zn(II)2Cys6 transcription factor n=1 Tax=Aspergillus stella-maris TaxID=1810926 RepID=UPI003CCDFF8C